MAEQYKTQGVHPEMVRPTFGPQEYSGEKCTQSSFSTVHCLPLKASDCLLLQSDQFSKCAVQSCMGKELVYGRFRRKNILSNPHWLMMCSKDGGTVRL